MTPEWPEPKAVKIYRALLNQTSTNAPVATVLQNTLNGTIIWSRNNTGYYFGTLNGEFPETKTFVKISNNSWIDASFTAGWSGINGIFVVSGFLNAGAFTESDDYLTDTPIEILVYNQ